MILPSLLGSKEQAGHLNGRAVTWRRAPGFHFPMFPSLCAHMLHFIRIRLWKSSRISKDLPQRALAMSEWRVPRDGVRDGYCFD